MAREVGEIDVDVSQALTGLKAVQREARKATQALRELQAEQARKEREFDKLFDAYQDLAKKHDDLKYVPTCGLVAELSNREGVREFECEYESNGVIQLSNGYSANVPGPSRVLVVTD